MVGFEGACAGARRGSPKRFFGRSAPRLKGMGME
jgi:hypothetical protein